MATCSDVRGALRTDEPLPAEKPDAYRAALEASALALGLLPSEHPSGHPSRQRTLRGQLVRASVSVVLRIGEAAGLRTRRDKRNCYTVARASAAECTAVIHLAQRLGLARAKDAQRARHVYLRVAQMLTELALNCG